MQELMFSGISESNLKKAEKYLSGEVSFRRGDELYRLGSIGIIISGSARVVRKNSTGGTVTMRIMSAGDMFGAASVFGEWKEDVSSIVAVTSVTAVYITEENLVGIFKEIPEVAVNYIGYLTERIRFLNRKIDAFSAGNTEEKLYEYLTAIADNSGKVSLDFGMAELSRRTKMGRSSLYRSLEKLENSGLIKREKNTFYIY